MATRIKTRKTRQDAKVNATCSTKSDRHSCHAKTESDGMASIVARRPRHAETANPDTAGAIQPFETRAKRSRTSNAEPT
jgi:hypothetical protein